MVRFITSNEGKAREAQEILSEYEIPVEQVIRPYKEIQADTLEEVVKDALGGIEEDDIFIEDSGLFVNDLGGFPGVYSRYVEDTMGNGAILKLLSDVKQRGAVFKSVVGYKDGNIRIFEGKVEGKIALEERGKSGFGYDPIFVPKGFNKTFAEDITLKMRMSHRKQAIEKLAKYLAGEHRR